MTGTPQDDGLNWYDPAEGFTGHVGRTAADSRPAWPRLPKAPAGAPNVVVIVLDDVGYAQLGCYGGLGGRIDTPHIDRLAAGGLRYNNWHTTALCAPSRAALLTGRNCHSVGVGIISEFATGYPGYHCQIPHEAAMLPAVLVEQGYNTMALGKWHLAPDEHLTDSGPFDRWPLGRGFERYYGFLPAETDNFHPSLWQDNQRVEPPQAPEDAYHLSEDLVDKAAEWLTGQQAVTPDKPFFLYLAFGACHSPHQAPPAYVERYADRFDDGWDVIRDETLAKQKELGIVPPNTDLPPRNPGVQEWDRLSDTHRRVFRRQMEVFAAMLTHTDAQVGRLVGFLDRTGRLDDTVIVVLSDNGASGEGGENGISDEIAYGNFAKESIEDLDAKLDRWGGPTLHPHYASGWAMCGNTPQRWYKQAVHEGGTRDPLIVHWPAGIHDGGAVRTQFHHITDIAPTLLDLIGLEMPPVVKGYPQRPIEGTSMAYTITDGDAPTRKPVQYFEMVAHRALWKDGWKAVTFHRSKTMAATYGLPAPERDLDFDADRWELYHLDEDWSEVHDLATAHPKRLKELVETWWVEAGKYNVLPLDDTYAQRFATPKPVVLTPQRTYTFYSPVKLIRSGSPDVRRRSHVITADVTVPAGGAEGVVVSNGGPGGGYALLIRDGRAVYVSNYASLEHTVIRSDQPVPEGGTSLRFEFHKTGETSGRGVLFQDGVEVGEAHIDRTNPIGYAFTEGLEIGSDSTAPVWPEYRSPYVFTGTITRVQITPGSDQVEDADTEVKLAMLRQ